MGPLRDVGLLDAALHYPPDPGIPSSTEEASPAAKPEWQEAGTGVTPIYGRLWRAADGLLIIIEVRPRCVKAGLIWDTLNAAAAYAFSSGSGGRTRQVPFDLAGKPFSQL
jgi:hypothetical protein